MRGYSFPGIHAGFENGGAPHQDADIILLDADPLVYEASGRNCRGRRGKTLVNTAGQFAPRERSR
jgi:hypothetical protein